MSEAWAIGETAEIKGLPGRWTRVEGPTEPPVTSAGLKCPCCGGFGIAWAGWFNCELCPAKWLWQSCEVFVPEGWRPGDTHRTKRERTEAAMAACWRE